MPSPEVHAYLMSASGREEAHGNMEVRFPYWSFTKTVLAACALKLAEAGALHLDDAIEGAPYTLRHLLTHTSGLPDYGHFPQYREAVSAGEHAWPRAKMLEIAVSKGMLFDPGEGWSYSNVGFMFVKELIETASQKPFAKIVTEAFREPLGLRSIELAESQPHFATLHWPAAATYDPQWVYHSCLIGNAPEAARLLNHILSGGWLSRASLDLMKQTKPLGGAIPGRPWQRRGYAMGLMAGEFDGVGRVLGHSGAGPFSVNAVYHFPDLDDPTTVACFSNALSEGVVENTVLDLVR